jgi:hypothetical protein
VSKKDAFADGLWRIQVVDDRPEVESILGQYLMSFDFEAHDGQGDGVFTPNIEEAMTFTSMQEVINFVKTQPQCKPLRDDGLPNRPMTAVSISIANG